MPDFVMIYKATPSYINTHIFGAAWEQRRCPSPGAKYISNDYPGVVGHPYNGLDSNQHNAAIFLTRLYLKE